MAEPSLKLGHDDDGKRHRLCPHRRPVAVKVHFGWKYHKAQVGKAAGPACPFPVGLGEGTSEETEGEEKYAEDGARD